MNQGCQCFCKELNKTVLFCSVCCDGLIHCHCGCIPKDEKYRGMMEREPSGGVAGKGGEGFATSLV
jgi:hypothetical protein